MQSEIPVRFLKRGEARRKEETAQRSGPTPAPRLLPRSQPVPPRSAGGDTTGRGWDPREIPAPRTFCPWGRGGVPSLPATALPWQRSLWQRITALQRQGGRAGRLRAGFKAGMYWALLRGALPAVGWGLKGHRSNR